MAFRSWFSRLRSSCSRPSFANLRKLGDAARAGIECEIPKRPFSFSLLPVAIAVSAAGSFVFQSQTQTSLCEASALDDTTRETMGGKGSSEPVVNPSHEKIPQELIDELKAILQDNMTVDYDERYFHGNPQNGFHTVVNIPDVVVSPRSEEEVSKIVKSCNKHKVPIVPYGGATSVEGHSLTTNGGVCIDMSSMNRVKALHIEDMDVVVEPGIRWMELMNTWNRKDLVQPLEDLVEYDGLTVAVCGCGTMRDNVISLKVVLPNGDIVKTASRARKSAAGYDLTRLIIGSEGTLGVITEVPLRLQQIPQYSVAAMCNFPTIKDAADVAIDTMHSRIQASRIELVDEQSIKALNYANGKNMPELPTLMLEFVGTGEITSFFLW